MNCNPSTIELYASRNSCDRMLSTCLSLLDGSKPASRVREPDWMPRLKDLIALTSPPATLFAPPEQIPPFIKQIADTPFTRTLTTLALAKRGDHKAAEKRLSEIKNSFEAEAVRTLCENRSADKIIHEIGNDAAELRRFAGRILMPRAEYQTAVALLERASASEPENQPLHLELAQAWADCGEIENTARLVANVRETKGSTQILLDICNALIHFNAKPQAAEILKRIDIRRMPPYAQTYRLHALFSLVCSGREAFSTCMNSTSTLGKLFVARMLYAAHYQDDAKELISEITPNSLTTSYEKETYLFTAYQAGIDLPENVWEPLLSPAATTDPLYARYLLRVGRIREAEAATDKRCKNGAPDGFSNLAAALLPQHLGWISPDLLWKTDPQSGQYIKDEDAVRSDRQIAEQSLRWFYRDLEEGRLTDFRRLQMVRLLSAENIHDEAKKIMNEKTILRMPPNGSLELAECARAFALTGLNGQSRRTLNFAASTERLPQTASPVGFFMEQFFSCSPDRLSNALNRHCPDGAALPFAMLACLKAGMPEKAVELHEQFESRNRTEFRGINMANIEHFHGKEKLSGIRGPLCDLIAACACRTCGNTEKQTGLCARLPNPTEHLPIAAKLQQQLKED